MTVVEDFSDSIRFCSSEKDNFSSEDSDDSYVRSSGAARTRADMSAKRLN